MSKIIKIIVEYDDNIQTLEGDAAAEWIDNVNACVHLVQVHGMNPFVTKPAPWNICKVEPPKQHSIDHE